MIHYMNLWNKFFLLIKNWTKDIELRLYDEKRNQFRINDKIVFTNTTTPEKLYVEVTNLYIYPSFNKLYQFFPKERLGYSSDEASSPDDMYSYYSEDDIKTYGVVGIEIKVIKDL